ncbi:collagen alpha-1(I) chain-like [Odocoileus virginianus]|uniref:Collagen alpha-1(I) chain-like n=1 Tax=Odocoileus virginianus TaxID=9874 RepID=A0ABM4ILM4_ODOVR
MRPARCPTAARPGGGGRRRGPVTSRVWQLPGPRSPAPDSRRASSSPGDQTVPRAAPDLCGSPGPGSSPRGRRRLNRPRPAPALPPPRSLPRHRPPPPAAATPRGSPESEFETEGTAAALNPPGSSAHPAQGLFWWSRQGGIKTGSPIWPSFGSWNSLSSRSPEAENQPQEMRKLRSERLISRGEFQAQGSDFDGYLWNRCCRGPVRQHLHLKQRMCIDGAYLVPRE